MTTSVLPSSLTDVFPTFWNPLALTSPLPPGGIGGLVGESHWQEIQYKIDDKTLVSGMVDTFTLDANKTGEAYLYAKKSCDEHYGIAISVLVADLLYVPGVMLYNALRILPIALYLIGRIPYDFYKQPEENRRTVLEITGHHLKQVAYQTWLSIANIVRTPYYALGFTFGVLYGALIDSVNGRKFAGHFEKGWNHNIERYRSFWSTIGRMKEFHFEGGGDPDQLGKHAFYLPGCYQPFGTVHFEGNEIKSIQSMHSKTPYTFVALVEKPTTTHWSRAKVVTALVVSLLLTLTAIAAAYAAVHTLPPQLAFLQGPLSMVDFQTAIALSVITGLISLRLLAMTKTRLSRPLSPTSLNQ